MKIIKSMLLLLAGAAFGVGFVLSCGDDSPRHVDAATCDCPASEPPLAGRVIAVESAPVSIVAGQSGITSVSCGAGQQFLSGGCSSADQINPSNITLEESSFYQPTSAWRCIIKNNEAR